MASNSLSYSYQNVPLYEHQQRTLAALSRSTATGHGLLWEMGLGKTRVALMHAFARGCKRILVACPLTGAAVWTRELEVIGSDMPTLRLTDWPSIKEKTERMKEWKHQDGMVVCNFDSYWREPLRTTIIAWQPDAVIIDEAHRIKHRQTRKAKFAYRLADLSSVHVRLVLTGTPVTNGLQDLWSLYRFILPHMLGSYDAFARQYLIMGGFQARQIVGYQHVEEMNALVARTSFQCRKDEALDLPPRTDVVVPIELDPETRKAYDTLKRLAIVELVGADGQLTHVVGRIVLTLLLRLQQVADGFARDVGGEIIELSNEKARATASIVEDAYASGQQVVVFARFLHDLDLAAAALPKELRVARIDGSVAPVERNRILDAMHAKQYDVLLIQLHTGSVAIDLTCASVAVFYSTGYSLEDFLQAPERLHRPGQHHPVTYYHLVAQNTVDEAVYRALRAKISIARAVTDLTYASGLLGLP